MRLARATATSMCGFLASIRASHEPSGAPRRAAHRTVETAPMMSRRRRSRLSHLRGLAQPLLATARMLTRGEPHPGGEVAALGEGAGWRREGRQRGGADRADPRDGHQARRRLVLPQPRAQLLLERVDPRRQRLDLREQPPCEGDDGRRQRAFLALDERGKPAEMRQPRWGDPLMLDEMAARAALIVWVRWRTNMSRVRNAIAAARRAPRSSPPRSASSAATPPQRSPRRRPRRPSGA